MSGADDIFDEKYTAMRDSFCDLSHCRDVIPRGNGTSILIVADEAAAAPAARLDEAAGETSDSISRSRLAMAISYVDSSCSVQIETSGEDEDDNPSLEVVAFALACSVLASLRWDALDSTLLCDTGDHLADCHCVDGTPWRRCCVGIRFGHDSKDVQFRPSRGPGCIRPA